MKPQLIMPIMLTFLASYMSMVAGLLAVAFAVWLNKVNLIRMIAHVVLNLWGK